MGSLAGINVSELLVRLGLKAERRGRELWAPCPCHADGQERTASFRVHDEPSHESKHGKWQCFGSCEVRGGSVIGLVMRMLGLDREDAWQWIGGEAAPPPPLEIDVEVRGRQEPFRLPSGVILAPLDRWVTPARRYAESRGLTPFQVERWRLGYAVEGRLKNRLVLPVRDHKGKLLSYTARTFTGSKKWLEPKAEEGGDKGSVFGEAHWPAVAERRRVVVVEAALDGLAVERVAPGIAIAAVYGSELLPGHVARLSTFREVLVASDPDGAGAKLAAQIAAALGRWCSVRRVELPDGHDPNSLEREDPARLLELLA